MSTRTSLEGLEGAHGQAPWPGQPVQRHIELKHNGCIQGTREGRCMGLAGGQGTYSAGIRRSEVGGGGRAGVVYITMETGYGITHRRYVLARRHA